jgi:cysteine sulfinate desulfinase/cysteine desulfurase-like protein
MKNNNNNKKKSVKKSVKKPVKKSVKKSVKKPVKKPVKKSVKKSNELIKKNQKKSNELIKKNQKKSKINPCDWIYLDNTKSSPMCARAENIYKKNIKSTPMTPETKSEHLKKSKDYLLSVCNTDDEKYTVYFTSGQIESNRLILCCAVNAYRKIRKAMPHVVISSSEHNSILTYAQSLYDSGQIELSIIKPNSYGCILSNTVADAIKTTTCIVLITYINHDLGSVNNIEKISNILHEKRIPLHSDCTYLFGRHKLDLQKTKIDSVSVTFDKINGPVAVGALIINNNFFSGYKLNEHSTTLNGKRQYDIPSIIASIEATKESVSNRKSKNKTLSKFRNCIIDTLGKRCQIMTFANFMQSDAPPLDETTKSKNKLVILGPPIDNISYYTPSILSLVIITEKRRTAVEIQKSLRDKGIMIGLPNLDECDNDAKDEEKCVLNMYDEIGMPKDAQEFIIRISLSDDLTQNKINKLNDALKAAT